MKIACPACAKNLVVADELVGGPMQCPACKEVFEAPVPSAEAGAPRARLVTAEAPRRRRRDPGLNESSRFPSRYSASEDHPGGRCYIDVLDDDVKLIPAIQKRFNKLIQSEQLDLRIMNENVAPPVELAANDVIIHGEVARCDYGSQFMRYFLGIVCMFGPGSCRLEVETEVETATGEKHRISSRSRRWFGMFGGTDSQLMKENVTIIATRIANEAARFVSGRRFLNAQVYACANWALGLGLASLLPYIGVPFGLVSLIVGLVALLNINQRNLPRVRVRAITGLVLPFVGFIGTAAVVLLTIKW